MNEIDPVSRGYNYRVVRQFSVMTIVWGVVGMLVGVVIAAQLACDFPAIFAWHHDIEDNEVGTFLAYQPQRLDAVDGFDDFVAFLAEAQGKHRENFRVVISNEDDGLTCGHGGIVEHRTGRDQPACG